MIRKTLSSLLVLAFGLVSISSNAMAQVDVGVSVSLQAVNGVPGAAPLVPGQTATFRIAVQNLDTATVRGLVVTADLRNISAPVVAHTLPNAWGVVGSGLTFSRRNQLAASTTENLDVTVFIPPDAHYLAQGPIRFEASVAVLGVNDTVGGNNDDSTGVLDIQGVSQLSIDKKLLSPSVAPGATALYEVSVCNQGPSDVRGVQVLDTPGANLDAGSLVLSPGAGNLNVDAGDCSHVFATAAVSGSAIPAANFSNQAEVDNSLVSSGNALLAGSLTAPTVNEPSDTDSSGVVAAVASASDVRVVSAKLVLSGLTPVPPTGPIVPGRTAQFEVVVENVSGVPAEGVTLVNTLRNISGATVVSLSGPSPWSPAGSGLTFTRLSPLAAGAVETLNVVVSIPSDAHYVAAGEVGFSASISSSNPDSDILNNTVGASGGSINVQANSVLTLDKQLLTPKVAPGDAAAYEVVVCNNGPSDIDGLRLNDVIGANLAAGSLVLSSDANDFYLTNNGCAHFAAYAAVSDNASIGANFSNTASILTNFVRNGSTGLGATALVPSVNAPTDSESTGLVSNYLPVTDMEIVSSTLVKVNGVAVAPSAPVVPGQTAEFSIVVRNNGGVIAEGVQLRNALYGLGTTVVSSSSSAGQWSQIGNGLDFARLQPLAPSASETLNIVVAIDADAHYVAKSVPTLVSAISADNPDSDILDNSNTLGPISVQAQATLSLTNLLLTPNVAPGGTAIYRLTVCSDGPSDIKGVKLLDVPSTGLLPATLVLPAEANSIYVSAGQCKSLDATAQVDPADVVGSNFTNNSSLDVSTVVSGSIEISPAAQTPTVNSPVTANNSVGVVANYLPSIDIRVSSSTLDLVNGAAPGGATGPLVPGTTAQFTVVVRNTGAAPAQGVRLLNSLTNVDATLVSSTVPGAWSVSGSGLDFSRIQPMAAGSSDTLTFTVSIPADAHYTAAGPINLISIVTSDNPELTRGNNTATLGALLIQGVGTLDIEKKLLTPNAAPGGTALYDISVCNSGPSEFRGISLLDVPAAPLVPGSIVIGQQTGIVVRAADCFHTTASATISDSATFGQTYANTVTQVAVSSGSPALGASALAPALVNDTDTETGTVGQFLPPADVQVTESKLVAVNLSPVAATGPLVPGQSATFQISVQNNGPAPAEHATIVSTLRNVAGVTGLTLSGSTAWSPAGSGLSLTRTQPLASGTSETFFVTVNIPASAHYTALANVGFDSTVSASNPDPVPANNTLGLIGNIQVQAQASLTIQKQLFTGQVPPGGVADYEITVCNNGPSDLDGVRVTDTPGTNLTPGSAILSSDANNLYLAVGQCDDVHVTAVVSTAAVVGASFANSGAVDVSTVIPGSAGLGVNALTPIIIVPPAAVNNAGIVGDYLPTVDLRVTSVTLTEINGAAVTAGTPLVPGQTATFEVDVENNGPAPAEGVEVSSTLRNINATLVSASSAPGNNWAAGASGLTAVRRQPMAAGVQETLIVTLLIPANAHYVAQGPAVFRAVATSDNRESSLGNNATSTGSINVKASAVLSLEKTLLSPAVAPGGTAQYVLTVCNDGPSDVNGLAIDDSPGTNLVPASLVIPSESSSFYVEATKCKEFNASAQVAESAVVGASFVNDAAVDTTNVIFGSAGLGGNALLPDVNQPTATASGTVSNYLPNADVQIVSAVLTEVDGNIPSSASGPLVPGKSAKFAVTVRNNGAAPAEGVVITHRLMDVDATLIAAENGGTPWVNAGPGLVSFRGQPMAAGVEETVTFTVLIPADAHYKAVGKISLRSIASSDNPDSVANNLGISGDLDVQADAFLTITKTLITKSVAPGGTALYEVTVCNEGPSDIDGVKVVDTTLLNLVAGSETLSSDAASLYVQAGRCSDILASATVKPSAAVGESFRNRATIETTGVIPGSAPLGVTALSPIVNTDVSTSNDGLVAQYLPNANVAVNSVTLIEVNGVASAPTDPLVPGQSARFKIQVENKGPAPAEGVSLVNNLRGVNQTTLRSLSGTSWSSPGAGLTFNREQPMPAGTVEDLEVEVLVPANAHYTSFANLEWIANIAASNPDQAPGNNRETSGLLTIQANSTLSIEKTLLTPRVPEGGTAIYEVTVCNAGPSDVASVEVLDTPGLNLRPNSVVTSSDSTELYIKANDCQDILVTSRVRSTAVVGAGFTNTAAVVASHVLAGSVSLGSQALTPVVNTPSSTNSSGIVGEFLPTADVSVDDVELTQVNDVAVSPGDPIVPGQTATFKVTVSNNGPAQAEGVILINQLSNIGAVPVNATSPGSDWNTASQGLTFTRNNPMPAGTTEVVRVTVMIPADAHYKTTGNYNWTSFVSTSNPDSDFSNNRDALKNIELQANAVLSITKTLFTPTVAPGGRALYEIEVCNAGPSDIDGVGILDTPGLNLNASGLIVSASASSLYVGVGLCSKVTATVPLVAGVAPGATFTNTAAVVTTNVKKGAGAATLAPVVNAPATGNVDGTVDDYLPKADVEIVAKRFIGTTVVPGTTATFEIDVRNNGPEIAEGVVVTDQFVNGAFTIRSSTVPAGWTQPSSGGTFTRTSSMPIGTIETLSVTVDIAPDAHFTAAGVLSNVASVIASNPDPNTSNNSNSTGTLPVQASSTLTLEKILVSPYTLPTGRAFYEITACNQGPSEIRGLSILDTVGVNLLPGSAIISPLSGAISLKLGECRAFTASAEVSFGATAGSTFTNSAAFVTTGVLSGPGSTLPPIVITPGTVSASGLVGPQLFTVSGQVQLSDGTGLADITIKSTVGNFTGLSDSAGNFTITGVPDGSYSLEAFASNGSLVGSKDITVSHADLPGVIIVATRALNGVAHFVWNGFLNQRNIVVAANKGDKIIDTTVTMHDLDGVEKSTLTFSLSPRSERDIIVNELAGFSGSSYGYLTVKFNNPQDFDGHVALYRMAPGDKDIEFSIIRPFENVQTGTTFGSFNTIQPSQDPEQAKNVIYQWIQLVNLDENIGRTFDIELFDQKGGLITARTVTVPPRARRDFEAGHDSPGAGFVGVIRVKPQDPATKYLSQIFRYGADAPKGVATSSFSFATGITTGSGTTGTQYAPISTGGGGINFVVVSNTSGTSTTSINAVANNSIGIQSATNNILLAPLGQVHIDVNSALSGGDSGALVVKSSNGAPLMVESYVYFPHPTNKRITAAYGTDARSILAGNYYGLYNTFFDQKNWLKVFNGSTIPTRVTMEVFDLNGASVGTGTFDVAPNSTSQVEIAFGFKIPNDTYGAFKVTSTVQSSVFAELVRTKPSVVDSSVIDFAASIPVR